ncbi:zinc-ribbon domain-containing protein [Clostridium uliginosum]|uniref:Zinc-ribbon domain-containing protein n=1 Tax=Clostridium uliginosum TaxID=119641 RepID=A0A1I1JUG0_9CLOT|nr:zinc-ribbon domain-containing protein [Clostridium uliginosum]SFC51881.1 zinc-ribbon domain-containing protein [Clostridium uliginosum]
MFCKNCGNKIIEGDAFCGNCGTPSGHKETSVSFTPPKVKDSVLMKLLKMYFVKPVSFFSDIKDKDLVKTSVALFLGLPIIYGILNMLYNSAVINYIFNTVKKLPDILVKAGIISGQDAISAKKELLMSNKMFEFKSKFDNMIDNKDVFLSGAGQLLVIIIVTGIVLALLNAVILKNKIKPIDILFISTVSYIPLVLAITLASIATLINIIFGLLILFSGYILSFITLYNGIKQFSDEKNDKVFILMAILFVLISAILSICIVNELEHSMASIINNFNSIEHLL